MARSIEMITESVFPFDGTLGIKPHTHPFYQIYYILEGVEVYVYDGSNIEVGEGQFLFVLPQKEHGLPYSIPNANVLDLKFHVADDHLSRELSRLPACIKCTNAMQQMFQFIYDEVQRKEQHYNSIICNMVESILYSALRIYCSQQDAVGTSVLDVLGCHYEELSECVRRTLLRIEGCIVLGPDRSLLDETAQALGYSKSYMCRRFSEEIGISILQYVTMLRMDKAKELLLHSDRSIRQIAGLLYFNDPGRFCKTFRKYTGMTPTQYRSSTPRDRKTLLYSYRKFLNK